MRSVMKKVATSGPVSVVVLGIVLTPFWLTLVSWLPLRLIWGMFWGTTDG
jgi:hypothetical protein